MANTRVTAIVDRLGMGFTLPSGFPFSTVSRLYRSPRFPGVQSQSFLNGLSDTLCFSTRGSTPRTPQILT